MGVTCPACAGTFANAHGLQVHINRMHKDYQAPEPTTTTEDVIAAFTKLTGTNTIAVEAAPEFISWVNETTKLVEKMRE